jgi:hypothetical protein
MNLTVFSERENARRFIAIGTKVARSAIFRGEITL